MMLNDKYPVAGTTLVVMFPTYEGSTGKSLTMTGLAITDIEVYKDGGTTQRAADDGFTLLDTDGIDFDGITGAHGFSIDLSDDTDSGFYAAESQYHGWVNAITVDSQTVVVPFQFTIVSATRRLGGTALPAAAADAAGGLPISDLGGLALDTFAAAAVKSAMGVVEITVSADAGNTSATFAVDEDDFDGIVAAGILKFDAGADLAGESRYVRIADNQVVVVGLDSTPAGLEEVAAFSAEPGEGDTGEFWPV